MQTNPESAAVEAVAWQERHRQRDGKWGAWSPCSKAYVDTFLSSPDGTYETRSLVPASALDALRGEVAENEGVIRVWRRRCEEAERRVAELHGVLSIAVGSLYRMDITKLDAGDRHKLDVLLDRLQTVIAKESP